MTASETTAPTRSSDAGSAACLLALVAMSIAWLAAPDIPITDHGGSGCGRWTPAEVVRFREQLALYALLPLLVAVVGAAYWTGRVATVVAALVTSALVTTVLWEPANPAYVWVQLAGLFLSPIWLGLAIWLGFRARKDPGIAAVLAGVVPPLLLLGLVAATRQPWIWSC